MHIETQRLREQSLRLRAEMNLTIHGKQAMDLLEAHLAAATSILFAMGNDQEPTG